MYIFYEPSKKELRASTIFHPILRIETPVSSPITKSERIPPVRVLYYTRPGHELIQARGKIEGGERQGLRLTSDHCQGHAGRGKKERGSRASSWDGIRVLQSLEANLFATPTTEKRECLYRAAFNLTSLEALV